MKIIEEKEQVVQQDPVQVSHDPAEKEKRANDDLGTIQTSSTQITLKPGSFDDEPIMLAWIKQNYQTTIWLRPENHTRIEFSKPKLLCS
jgi:hypothetical protein